MKLSEFPKFMRQSCNAVRNKEQDGGMEGYVFDGADGSQIVIWQFPTGRKSEIHIHDYDEYAIVVHGTFTGTIGGNHVILGPGDECVIPAGVSHGGVCSANYRAIDAFGGRRVKR